MGDSIVAPTFVHSPQAALWYGLPLPAPMQSLVWIATDDIKVSIESCL